MTNQFNTLFIYPINPIFNVNTNVIEKISVILKTHDWTKMLINITELTFHL
jgi:hypothetical protein